MASGANRLDCKYLTHVLLFPVKCHNCLGLNCCKLGVASHKPRALSADATPQKDSMTELRVILPRLICIAVPKTIVVCYMGRFLDTETYTSEFHSV